MRSLLRGLSPVELTGTGRGSRPCTAHMSSTVRCSVPCCAVLYCTVLHIVHTVLHCTVADLQEVGAVVVGEIEEPKEGADPQGLCLPQLHASL